MKQPKSTSPSRRSIKHPGEVLLNQFMMPLGLTACRLAKALHVTPTRVGEIIDGRRGVTAQSALRLSRFFGTTANFWLNLQSEYDLCQAKEKWGQIIETEISPHGGSKVAKQGKKQKEDSPEVLATLSANEKKIFGLISDDLIYFEDLFIKSSMSVDQLSATLTMLEISGLVRRHAGDHYSK